MRKRFAALALLAAIATGCGQAPWEDSLRDLEGVEARNPDVVIWNNIDKHPNIARSCLDGVAFATTTREYGDAVIRVEEWDQFCEETG